MRRPLLIGALAAAVIALVASAAVAAGTLDSPSPGPTTRGQGPYAAMMGGQGQNQGQNQGQGRGRDGGMMGGQGQGRGPSAGMMGGSMMGSMGMVWLPGDGTAVPSIPAARARAGLAAKASGLHPGEVMWFDNGFYVELKDSSGQPATEVILDPATGAVSTEPGPAMMWNTRFGMMGAGSTAGTARAGGTAGTGGPVDSTKARGIATSWLAANRPGTTVRSIDAYPGYFTLDLQRNGVVSGMMSVSSSTGAPWYHTWHGAFLSMEDS